MPFAARTNDPTSHGNPLNPGPGSLTVKIGNMPAWRALPSSVASAVDGISNAMNSFMTKPVMTPADATADLAQISAKLTQGGAAAAWARAAAGAAGSQVATLNSTNVTLTATWTTASAAPGGQPAANQTYTEMIKAAAAVAATAVMSAMAGLADMHICPLPVPVPPHGPGFVTKGSSSVLIDNLPACRQGDKVMEACGGPDPIAMGCTTVVIGDSGSGGGGGGGGGGGDQPPSEEPPPPTETPPPEPQQRTPGPSGEKVDTGTHWIEIELVDEADQAVVGEPFLITLPSGERSKEIRNRTDMRGMYRVQGLKRNGSCEISFTDLDLAAWQRWTANPPPSAPSANAPPQSTSDDGPVSQPPGPVQGGRWIKAAPGDCISSIAVRTGHFWDTIWNHANNAELKRRRGSPNVLLTDDAVFIPDKRPRTETGATDQHHKFLRRGEPSRLQLVVQDNGRPIANAPYELDVDGQTFTGTTGPKGEVDVRIPGNSRRAKLVVTAADGKEYRYNLALGGVDPITSRRGVCQRLFNLGYNCPENASDKQLEAALRAFQRDNGLPDTGSADEATRQKLREKHGS